MCLQISVFFDNFGKTYIKQLCSVSSQTCSWFFLLVYSWKNKSFIYRCIFSFFKKGSILELITQLCWSNIWSDLGQMGKEFRVGWEKYLCTYGYNGGWMKPGKGIKLWTNILNWTGAWIHDEMRMMMLVIGYKGIPMLKYILEHSDI